jgi:hypothetical protein
MSWLVGETGRSLVDVWTVPHLGFWTVWGSTGWALKVKHGFTLLVGLSLAVSWEIFERFAERLWPQTWLNPESWWNAWISDPLTCVVGVCGMYLALDRWGGRRK